MKSLVKRATRLFALCGLFIACVSLTSSNLKPDSESMMISIQDAYGQMPGAGSGNSNGGLSGPGNPGSSFGDNSTLSPDTGNDVVVPGQNDTLGGQGMNNPDAAAQIANPYANTTSPSGTVSSQSTVANQTVPEFGPISIMILAVAVVSTVLVTGKTRLRFGL